MLIICGNFVTFKAKAKTSVAVMGEKESAQVRWRLQGERHEGEGKQEITKKSTFKSQQVTSTAAELSNELVVPKKEAILDGMQY